MKVKDYKPSNSDTRMYIVIGNRGYYMESHDCVRVFTANISEAKLFNESEAIAMSKVVHEGTYRFIEDFEFTTRRVFN